jgi:uncharacterized membrane protein YbhN (UPF0104 family)
VVRAMRWRLLMHGMQVRTRFVDLYLCSSIALSLSVFTPLQSGEVLKVELMKKYGGLERSPGYSAFLLERAADLYAVLAIGMVALVASTPAYAILLTALLLALPMGAHAALHRFRLPGRAGQFLINMQDAVQTQGGLTLLLIMTSLGWAMVALGWHASLRSVSIQIDVGQLLGLVSVITLATIASFVPGGLGVTEVGVAEMLLRYGISAPLAQAGALALRGYSLLIIALGLLHYFLFVAIRHRVPARHNAG